MTLVLQAVNMDADASPVSVALFSALQAVILIISSAMSMAMAGLTYAELLKMRGEYEADSEAPAFG